MMSFTFLHVTNYELRSLSKKKKKTLVLTVISRPFEYNNIFVPAPNYIMKTILSISLFMRNKNVQNFMLRIKKFN